MILDYRNLLPVRTWASAGSAALAGAAEGGGPTTQSPKAAHSGELRLGIGRVDLTAVFALKL